MCVGLCAKLIASSLSKASSREGSATEGCCTGRQLSFCAAGATSNSCLLELVKVSGEVTINEETGDGEGVLDWADAEGEGGERAAGKGGVERGGVRLFGGGGVDKFRSWS